MNKKIAAAILAGGKSTRLHGVNKGNLKTNNITFINILANELKKIEIYDCIIVSCENRLFDSELPIINDNYKNIGPIGGIEAAMNYFKSSYESTIIFPCDTPLITKKEINILINSFFKKKKEIIFSSTNLRFHPLFCIIKNCCHKKVVDIINTKNYKLLEMWKNFDFSIEKFENELAFTNVNTKDELYFIKNFFK